MCCYLECSSEPITKRGDCDPSSGVAIDFIVSSRFDKETCSCKRSSKPVQRVCGKRKISPLIRIIDHVFLDCSHLPPLAPKEYCDESGKYLITEKFGYALRNMTCKKTTDVERQRISKDIFSL